MQGHVSPAHCDVCHGGEKLMAAKTYCETLSMGREMELSCQRFFSWHMSWLNDPISSLQYSWYGPNTSLPCNCILIKTHIVLLLSWWNSNVDLSRLKLSGWSTCWMISMCVSHLISHRYASSAFLEKTLNRSVCRRPSPVKCEVSKKRTFQSLL